MREECAISGTIAIVIRSSPTNIERRSSIDRAKDIDKLFAIENATILGRQEQGLSNGSDALLVGTNAKKDVVHVHVYIAQRNNVVNVSHDIVAIAKECEMGDANLRAVLLRNIHRADQMTKDVAK